jgi:hypothetical protein
MTLHGVLRTTTLNKYSMTLTAADVGLNKSYWSDIQGTFANKGGAAVTRRYDARVFLGDKAFHEASSILGGLGLDTSSDLPGIITHEFFHRIGLKHANFPKQSDIQRNCGTPGLVMGSN